MLNERKLTKAELNKREDIVKDMKKNKRALVKKYGKDAEKVMYGRATNIAKKQAESMNQDKLREMIKDSLQNPKKADLNKDGKLSDYEKKRGAAIEKSMIKEMSGDKMEALMELRNILDELQMLGDQARDIIANSFPSFLSKGEAYGAFDLGSSSNRYDTTIASIVDEIEEYGDEEEDEDMMQEDMDLGHQDNEPHMLKADLYRIGKYAMELYQMVDGFEGKGEVDFPHWWQSKVIKAKDYLVGAKHYLDFELKEPQIDATLDEIGMFNDPIGYEKSEPNPKDLIFTKKFVGTSDTKGHAGYIYDIYKNGVKIKTIKGEGEANAYINQLKREMNEGMSEEEWAKAKEEDRLAKLPKDQQAKIKKAYGVKDRKEADKFAGSDPKAGSTIKGTGFDWKKSVKEEEAGEADMVASDIQKAMNAAKGDEAKTHQLKKARTAMNKGDLDKAKKIADRIAKMLKNK